MRKFNIYLDPVDANSLDSMEGIPRYETTRHVVLPGEKFLKYQWQKWLHRLFDWLGSMAPGFVLAVAVVLAGVSLANWVGKSIMGFKSSPLSPILVTLVLGLVVRNVAGLPAAYEKGLRLCVTRILRIGVALLGLRLSISAVGMIGLKALPIVIGSIAAALIVVTWLSRLVGLSSRLGSLIAVGTSICGVSAIMTTGPAIKANEEEVSYAVALIALFGMTAMFTYPLLAHWMFGGDAEQIGFFLGAAIHDTSQVAGSGLVYQLHFEAPQALDVAVTTKLVRNACMGAVLPLIAILYHRQSSSEASATHRAHWLKWSQWIPPFVVLFLGLAAIRSIGDLGDDPFGVLNRGTWVELISISKIVSIVCLTTAMAAVGLGTSFSQLRMLGWKPLCIGCSAAVLVGGVSCLLVTILGHWQ